MSTISTIGIIACLLFGMLIAWSYGYRAGRHHQPKPRHIVQAVAVRSPYGGPTGHGWACSCGEHETYLGPTSATRAWETAQMHCMLQGGTIK